MNVPELARLAFRRGAIAMLWLGAPLALLAAVDVEFLDTDGYVFTAEERKGIETIVKATEAEARVLLPALPKQMLVTVMAGKEVIPELGFVAYSHSPGVVRWIVDPRRPEGVSTLAQRNLRLCYAHELHHQARGTCGYGGEPVGTFLDGVIAEGLATAFERDAFGSKPLHGEYTPETANWVAEVIALPPDAPFFKWMVAHPDGRRFIGYRVGTYLVDKAMAASGRTAAQLARTSTAEILALAGVDRPSKSKL